jgi:hypothetical protein
MEEIKGIKEIIRMINKDLINTYDNLVKFISNRLSNNNIFLF